MPGLLVGRPGVSRRRVIALAVAVLVLLTAGGAVAVTRAGRVPPPQQPRMTWTVDANALRLRIENVNHHWGLRDQQLLILYQHEDGAPIRVFVPGERYDRPDGSTFVCCLISHLPPHGVVTFDLPPTKKYKVYYIDVQMRRAPGWLRM